MPVATSLTRSSEHSRPCSSASRPPAAAPIEHAQPRRAGQVGAAEGRHGRQHQHAFEPEVDAARFLGQAFAQAHEQEGRADAQRAADDAGDQRDPLVGRHGVRLRVSAAAEGRSFGTIRRPVDIAQRLARQDQHEGDALQHQHRGVGQAEPALQQAAGRAEAAEQDRHRDDRQRVVPRDEGHQDAGIAVAGDQRGVGVGVHRRHLDRAGQAGAGAAERAGQQDQPGGRQADQLRRARIAADHAHREARRRPAQPQAEADAGHARRAPAPSARPSRRCRRCAGPRPARGSTACSGWPGRAAAPSTRCLNRPMAT